MKLKNDNSCSWINDLNPRSNIKTLKETIRMAYCWAGCIFIAVKIVNCYQIKKSYW